jgi:hypothetical protein
VLAGVPSGPKAACPSFARDATFRFFLLALCAGGVLAQLPFHPKFLVAEQAEEPPVPSEEQNDALNLHEPVASVAVVVVGCTARGSDFKVTLLQTDEASGQWHVYGMGPFRIDSCFCKAALVAGVLQTDGGEVTVTLGELEPELAAYATVPRFTFCFKGMAKCEFDHDPTDSRTSPAVPSAF